MKKESLYRMAVKVDKETREDNKYYCPFCFVSLIEKEIRESSYLQDFLKWQEKNTIYTVCGSVLFYLQDLGIIEILSGAAKRAGGVDCNNLKIKVLHPSEGNKI